MEKRDYTEELQSIANGLESIANALTRDESADLRHLCEHTKAVGELVADAIDRQSEVHRKAHDGIAKALIEAAKILAKAQRSQGGG